MSYLTRLNNKHLSFMWIGDRSNIADNDRVDKFAKLLTKLSEMKKSVTPYP